MFDICSLANSLALGLLIFVVLYSGRRAYNRYERRNVTGNVNDNPKSGDVDNGVPPLLEWGLDDRDRDLIRGALVATGIALLFCYLKNRKCKGPECGYDQPLSQEGYEFDVYENGEYGPFARRMTSDPQSPLRPSDLTDIMSALRASDLTQMSDIAAVRQNGGLDEFVLLNRPGANIEVGVMPPPPPPPPVTDAVTKYLLTPDALLRVTR
jgi:hypothetical protein